MKNVTTLKDFTSLMDSTGFPSKETTTSLARNPARSPGDPGITCSIIIQNYFILGTLQAKVLKGHEDGCKLLNFLQDKCCKANSLVIE